MRKIKAFSLIELSVALLIIGIILSSIFKGAQLIESAKIQSVAKQFQEIRLNIENYMVRYGDLVGPYQTLEDMKTILAKLYDKGIVRSSELVRSKLGGLFKIKTIEGRHYLQLVTDADAVLLNTKQVENLKSFVDGDLCKMDGDVFSYLITE